MKKLLLFILIFAFSVSAQTPRTVYNKDKTRLIGIYNLENCSGKSKTFAGIISRALVSAEASQYAFDLGKDSFWLGYAGFDESDKSKLPDFVKQSNRVSITACPGDNGIWRVMAMKLR